MARNRVIEGAFINTPLRVDSKGALIAVGIGGFQSIYLNSSSVVNYHILSDEESYSFSSGIARGLVGNALFGTMGLVAGALSAKDNNNLIIIEFVDGQKSMIEVNGSIARAIIQKCSSLNIPNHSDNTICEKCKNINSNNSKFCIECGSKLPTATTNNQDTLQQQEYKPIPIKTHKFLLSSFIILFLISCFFMFLNLNS